MLDKTRKKYVLETLDYIKKNEYLQKMPIIYRYKIDSFDDIRSVDLHTRDRTIPCNIKILKADTIDTLIKYQKETGKKFCFMAFVDSETPGGNYLSGSKRQETNCAIRTNMSVAYQDKYYPHEEYGGLYAKNIVIFRDNEENKFKFLKDEIICDCVYTGLYNKPPIDDKRLEPEYAMKTRMKLIAMMDECLRRNMKNLILGPVGCGVFKNPSEHIAIIFKELVHSLKYKNRFENIIFAIKGKDEDKIYNEFFDFIKTDTLN